MKKGVEEVRTAVRAVPLVMRDENGHNRGAGDRWRDRHSCWELLGWMKVCFFVPKACGGTWEIRSQMDECLGFSWGSSIP